MSDNVLLITSDAGGSDPVIEKLAQRVMARYLVALAAFLMQPQPADRAR
jgi:hypothetical protein